MITLISMKSKWKSVLGFGWERNPKLISMLCQYELLLLGRKCAKVILMKKVFLVLILASALLASACSSREDSVQESSQTLRSEAMLLSSSTEWTSQIDASVLTGKIQGIKGGSPSVPQTTLTVNAVLESQPPVYPSLPGFYELDLSGMEADARTVLESFCKALVSGKDAESFMESKNLYSLAIFRYDLRMELGKNFSLQSYVAGKPASTKDVYECPVRFFVKGNSYFDAVVYVHKAGEEWKVAQIAFRNSYQE